MDAEILRYRQEIENFSKTVASWQWQADLQICLVVAVLLFGALITVFQGLNKGWSKPATLVLGAGTTILTGVNAKVFTADYRVFQLSALDAAGLIEQLNSVVDNIGRSQADVKGLELQWVKTVTQFRSLQSAVLRGTQGQTAAPSIWIKTVYAQQQSQQAAGSPAPSWITRPPTDSYSLYFVGIGEDSSISKAQQQSFGNAVAAGVGQLSKGSNMDEDALRKFLSSSSAPDKSYFVFDNSRGVYRYYTLVRISNDVKNVNFTLSKPSCVQATIKERTWQRLDLPEGGGTIILALRDLYRVNRGPDASQLYLIATSTIYNGRSGKFEKTTRMPPASVTTEFRFSNEKDFGPFQMMGRAYRLRITRIVHNCVGSGCQNLSMDLCTAD